MSKRTERRMDGIVIVEQPNGPTLGYSEHSNVQLIEQDGKWFKDLSKDGKLDPYEDWRLTPEERARDLASKLSIEQIAGLMLYSAHQAVPANQGFFPATYRNGKGYDESGAAPSELTDQQIQFLTRDHVRHVLLTVVESPTVAAQWNNNVQALVESLDWGIPANNSSDPRHGSDSSAEYNIAAGGKISMWPEPLGLAATFNPEIVKQFGQIAAKEYRALGITTALSPQIDIATDPRWGRFNGTFGEDPQLSTDMAQAYIDGLQTSEGKQEIIDGWGYDSVNAMVKHWPGGGSGEGGRDAHFGYGKYAIFPGNNLKDHLKPFTEGAFKLQGKTRQAAAVMPYYTISYNQDTKYGENVGNSYSKYLITDLLRETCHYDGVVCTDWGITDDEPQNIENLFPGGRSWGVEEGCSVAERHYKLIMAGVDQFGGNNAAGPIIEAYQIGVKQLGEQATRARFEKSAYRLLLNFFRTGLFENPYLVPEKSQHIVGHPSFIEAGYRVQLESIVLLKNKGGLLPLAANTKVYIPRRYVAPGKDWFGFPIAASNDHPFSLAVAGKTFTIVDSPEQADVALVGIQGAAGGTGYSGEDKENGGNGYVPISLQYRQYCAETAREHSIAGDSRAKDVYNRSYKGKCVRTHNESDLDLVLETKRLMNGKPVIVSLLLNKPTIVSEFEAEIDALLVNFGVQDQAIFDVLSGAFAPRGLLPMQLPAHMTTVEAQLEDVPHDMEVHVDECGNAYDFAFGLSYTGVIADERVQKYAVQRAK